MKPIEIYNTLVYPYESMDKLIEDIGSQKKLFISVNAEILINANNTLRNIINQNIGYADGIGAVKILQKKGAKKSIKIPGCELWLKLIEKYSPAGAAFYLIGATEETIKETYNKLIEIYPHINISGYRNGYIKSKEEQEAVIADIENKKPDFIFVAMGSPKQEILMDEMYKRHKAVYLNLGGSFDVFTEKIKRAPKSFQNIGLEWFFRILIEPNRIKRQGARVKYMWLYMTGKL